MSRPGQRRTSNGSLMWRAAAPVEPEVGNTRWVTIGTAFETDDKIMLQLDALPTGKKWDGRVALFPMTDDYQRRQPPQVPAPDTFFSSHGADDDIPF